MANLSNRVLSELELALPEKDQQSHYLNLINSFEKTTFDLEKAYYSKLEDLEDLRQSLLQKAFAGELT